MYALRFKYLRKSSYFLPHSQKIFISLLTTLHFCHFFAMSEAIFRHKNTQKKGRPVISTPLPLNLYLNLIL